jgi:hypothetical protein
MERLSIDRISTGVARATTRRRFATGVGAALIATVPAVGLMRGASAATAEADNNNERDRKCKERCDRRCENRDNPDRCRQKCRDRRCQRDDND